MYFLSMSQCHYSQFVLWPPSLPAPLSLYTRQLSVVTGITDSTENIHELTNGLNIVVVNNFCYHFAKNLFKSPPWILNKVNYYSLLAVCYSGSLEWCHIWIEQVKQKGHWDSNWCNISAEDIFYRQKFLTYVTYCWVIPDNSNIIWKAA